jgi:FkbM family methyltransferase
MGRSASTFSFDIRAQYLAYGVSQSTRRKLRLCHERNYHGRVEPTERRAARTLKQGPARLAALPPGARKKLSSLTGLSVEEVIERLFSPGAPQTVRVVPLGETEITVRPGTSDVLGLLDTFLGLYHLPPPGTEPRVILDLGSNIGTTIAHFAYLYDDVRVCGVELDTENAALCARNIAPWGDRCEVLHAAVAGKDGTSGYDREVGDELAFKIGSGSSPVRTLSLDSVLDHFDLQEVDYVKMDIEGAELEVLQNAGRWPERVRSLKVEVHPPCTVEAVFGELVDLGYWCHRDDRHWSCVVARSADFAPPG